MTLAEFLKCIKKLIEKDSQCLNMLMFASNSSSGELREVGHLFVEKISLWDKSDMPLKEMLPNNYIYDDIITITTN